jgi:toxin ParE1/3/4
MAEGLEWSDQAIRDVEELSDYIGRSSPQSATAVVMAIRQAALGLELFPMAFRMVPELCDPVIREAFVDKWRVMYRVLPGRVRIVGVVHGARLLENDPHRSFEDGPQVEYMAL